MKYQSSYKQRFKRNAAKAKVTGVCAGIADYFEVSHFSVRCVTVIGLFVAFAPVLFGYIVASVIMDR
jgi:phage shock protein PspC (stress-responsive transcriptional regulator)